MLLSLRSLFASKTLSFSFAGFIEPVNMNSDFSTCWSGKYVDSDMIEVMMRHRDTHSLSLSFSLVVHAKQ